MASVGLFTPNLLFAQAKSAPPNTAVKAAPKAEAPKADAAPKAAAAPKAEAPKADPAPKTVGAQKAPAKASEMTLGRLIFDDSVFFMTTNGWKKPAANSTNKTEQFWAVESVQDFFQQLSDELKQTVEQHAQGNAETMLAATTIPVFLSAAIEHPIAISLISFTTTDPPEIKLSVVIDTESDEKEVRDALEKLIDAAPEEGPNSLEEETIEDAKFYSPNADDHRSGPLPQFGMYKSYLILTMGPDVAADTIKKINGARKTPKSLESALSELKVDRPSSVWQIDAAAIWKIVDPLINDQMAQDILDATGVKTLKKVTAVSGLDAVASVDKLSIETTEAPRGVLALLPNKPLTAADLKGIPNNPASATVIRFDLEELVEGILKIADQVDQMPRQQFDALSIQGEQILGFSIKDDLLKAFGDTWCCYVSSTESGGGLVPGLVLTASIRDQKKMTKVHDSIIGLAKNLLVQMGPQAPVTIQDFTMKGTKGHKLTFTNLPVPVSPSWVVGKDQFVFGVTPQLVTVHLGAANAAKSLADNDDVKTALKRDPQAVIISYRDPKPEIQGLYTMVNMFSPILTGQLQQQGIEFNLPPLPPFSDLEPHLAPSVTTISQTKSGWRCESHGVIPSFSAATPAVAAVGVGLLLPAVQQAREAARRTQSKNNLKQIALAMFNHEAAFQRFPARFTRDKNENPGLSWRVKLLPFLDQQELYEQFHLDEPWDSEHNKTLLEKMPAIYASPNDPDLAKAGQTRYVVLVGEGTLFDNENDEGPRIADVTDGTSNTIMVVEARSDAAVNWTEPEDLEIDDEDPLAGLEGARVGGFLAALADGSVRFISDNIDLDVLKALMTRAGGEVVGEF
jgi:hypothetical protein